MSLIDLGDISDDHHDEICFCDLDLYAIGCPSRADLKRILSLSVVELVADVDRDTVVLPFPFAFPSLPPSENKELSARGNLNMPLR